MTRLDVVTYLKLHGHKFQTLAEACRRDPNFKKLYHLKYKRVISHNEISSYFKPKASVRMNPNLLKLIPHKKSYTKKDEKRAWLLYLKKNASLYHSFTHFIDNDELGYSLRYACHHVRGEKLFHPPVLALKFWPELDRSREVKAMDSLAVSLKRMKQVRDVKREFCLNTKSRVDIKLILQNGRIILIEGKHDDSNWNKKKMASQISRYKKLGKKLFGNKYQKTILCSPKGKYGISFKAVKEIIEKN